MLAEKNKSLEAENKQLIDGIYATKTVKDLTAALKQATEGRWSWSDKQTNEVRGLAEAEFRIKNKEMVDAAKKLTAHLDIILGDVTLSGTYHLKERLKKAIENLKAQE